MGIQPLRSGWSFEKFVELVSGFNNWTIKVPLGAALARLGSQSDEAFVAEVEDRAKALLGPYSHNEYLAVAAHFGCNWRLNMIFSSFNLKYSDRPVPAAPKSRKRKTETMGGRGRGGGDGKRAEAALVGQPPKKLKIARKADEGRLLRPNEAGAAVALLKVAAAASRKKLSDPLAAPTKRRVSVSKGAELKNSGELLLSFVLQLVM